MELKKIINSQPSSVYDDEFWVKNEMPEHRLIIAILERAIVDALSEIKKKKKYKDGEAYIMNNSDYLGSFSWCCSQICNAPEKLMMKIRSILDMKQKYYLQRTNNVR